MHFPFDFSRDIIGPVNGLVCILNKRITEGKNEAVAVLCNPTTGQSLPLPKVETTRFGVACYLGYDPINKQFKVLSVSSTTPLRNAWIDEHQILTIGTGNMSWRKIECDIPPYCSSDKGIYINGVLYYRAAESSCGCGADVDGRSGSIELWVLEDVEKQEWSKHMAGNAGNHVVMFC